MLDWCDLIITVAYFSIPLQILASLWQYPRLAIMPIRILVLLVFFALFILLCGVGHMLRCMHLQHTTGFMINNTLTAIVSLTTAIYLLPLIPNLLGMIDDSIRDSIKLNLETAESKAKLLTFMAFLCHEIRNPLFAITSAARFLSDTDMTEEQEIGVGSIFDSSLLMLRLVNDVLDLSKIDAGKLELEERDFDLHRLLENLEVNMKLQIEQKHGNVVQLSFCVAPNVPKIVYGDSTRMLQIVYNLISNASKFTEAGHVKLRVSLCDDEVGNSTLDTSLAEMDQGYEMTALKGTDQFSMGLLDSMEEGVHGDHEVVKLKIVVEDTGVGIDPERIKHVFEPYSQAKLSDYRKHGGTGLGLAIISSLIKLMNGSIRVESKVAQGSTFTLLLPLHVSPNQQNGVDDGGPGNMSDPFLSARRLPVYPDMCTVEPDKGAVAAITVPSSSSSSNPNCDDSNDKRRSQKEKKPQLPKFHLPKGKAVVLVVDDNRVNRKILGKMLDFYNLEYETAEHGQEAVDLMRKSRNMTGDPEAVQYGLVFMDLSMPVMDGFEATQTMRSDGMTLPIVALTANALSQEKRRAFEAGATEFHTKPILREDLHGICQAHLCSPGRHPGAGG